MGTPCGRSFPEKMIRLMGISPPPNGKEKSKKVTAGIDFNRAAACILYNSVLFQSNVCVNVFKTRKRERGDDLGDNNIFFISILIFGFVQFK